MKKLACLSICLLGLALTSVVANDQNQPRGTLLELHSCELFAGGCVISSEEPLDGRYMLRAWNFTGGSFEKTELKDLQLAVLQSSTANLAAENIASDRAVIYLPKNATAAQRKALIAWAKSTLPDLKDAKLQTRTVALQFGRTQAGYSFSAGDSISVKTASLESCDAGGCGEALWYSPRTSSTLFTVAVDRASHVDEPLLKLSWHDAGKRSIFLARFGDRESSRNLYVTAADLCGPTDKLF